ncbi:MAG: FAD-binding oxidoreductase [SAR202 cluster bacterium]|nr:FAD-binding oxidoreductase [SAR202 cluster bacterium]
MTTQISAYTVDGKTPHTVLRPSTTEDLRSMMAAASADKLAVVPWGGGTKMALGNPPERYDAALDLQGLGRIVSHNPADLTATVEAGITIAALQDALTKRGQFVALGAPLADRATVGGTLAVGTAGPLKWQYGSPRDVVIGMTVVQADGKATKSGGQVVKNVSGYDMARLHVGGLGTLGVIAQVSFKLTPLPAREATLLSGFASMPQAMAAALAVFHGGAVPLALTTFDDDAARRMAMPGSDAWRVAVEMGGRPLSLERQVKECEAALRAHGAARVDRLDAPDPKMSGLWRKLTDFGWDQPTRPTVSARVSLVPSKSSEFLEALEHVPGERAVVSHPAHGTVLVHWYGTADDAAAKALSTTREVAVRLGGSAVFERCPVALKASLDVWGDARDSLAVMRRMKEQYDPGRLLNPGRFVGGI